MGITAGTGDLQAPTHLPLRFVATTPFRAAAPGPLPSQPLTATEKTRRPRSSARPPATCTRTRMLPALPRVLAPSQLPPTQSRAPARGLRAAARRPWRQVLAGRRAVGGCCGAGRVAPLSPPEPGYLRNSALGLWGAKCNPNPIFPNPAQINMHKHAHRRRRGWRSPPQVQAGRRPARAAREEPRPERGRRLRLAARGAAARPRPLTGAT
nr:PREDICTED: altered inheritance of mitochondria protein 3-like [Macaca fascicularis]